MSDQSEQMVEVKWQVADGYCGGSRPQSTELHLEDFDVEMSEGEIEDLIYEMVDDDFRQTITPGIENMDEVVEQIQAALAARSDDD